MGKPEYQIAANIEAWEHDTYPAWVERFGTPTEAASKIAGDPAKTLFPLTPHLGQLQGANLINLMGSHGTKAVAAALLGATVTVVDASPSNAQFAHELAAAAHVDLDYIVGDVLDPDLALSTHGYDIALAEMGILHYFLDLNPLANRISTLLSQRGRFVLRDFHPVSTKLLSYRGSTAKVRKYKVNGNYFDTSLETRPVPFAKHMGSGGATDGSSPVVQWRRWTLGEIVTAFASTGLRITQLVEEPNLSSDVYDVGIPKTFILVAEA